MKAKTCCFIGHSRIYAEVTFEQVAEAVERHITEYGVTDFLVGNYGDFDRMSARAVKAAKARHPNIHLYLMLPYRPELGRPLPDREGYDNFVYPEEMEDVPHKFAILRLNRLMAEDADYAIAYVRFTWGGAYTTLEYARRREKKGLIHIENLADGAV